jgi:hypothetical protein
MVRARKEECSGNVLIFIHAPNREMLLSYLYRIFVSRSLVSYGSAHAQARDFLRLSFFLSRPTPRASAIVFKRHMTHRQSGRDATDLTSGTFKTEAYRSPANPGSWSGRAAPRCLWNYLHRSALVLAHHPSVEEITSDVFVTRGPAHACRRVRPALEDEKQQIQSSRR